MVSAASSRTSRSDHGHSIVDGTVIVAAGMVVRFSRRNQCMSVSSAGAEYASLAECSEGAILVRHMMGMTTPGEQRQIVSIHGDKHGAVYVANDPVSSARSEHVDPRGHSHSWHREGGEYPCGIPGIDALASGNIDGRHPHRVIQETSKQSRD